MKFRKLLVCTVSVAGMASAYACRTANDASVLVSDGASVSYADETPQILSAATIETYRAALPKFAYERLNKVVNDPRTFWYDEEVMIASYQDTVSLDIIGCRKNSSGAGLIVPQGRKLFNQQGTDFSFPFGHTAGTDNATNLHVANFMSLPVVGGKQQPIAYYVKNSNISNLGVRQWRWVFPKGTLMGELLYVKDKQGNLYLSELRTRERHLSGWATNSYRPFATAAQLATAIKERRPNWQGSESLRAAVESLGDTSTLKAKTLNSSAFPGVFNQTGMIDDLPDLRDDDLVKDLLTKTTFVSVYGAEWKSNGNAATFAPNTKAPFSIVPANNDIGMIPVNDESCARCHQDAQRPIHHFAEQAILYGDVWGSDQIFSFHPFDQSICTGAGADQRRLRPAFKGKEQFIQTFSPQLHPKEFYTEVAKY